MSAHTVRILTGVLVIQLLLVLGMNMFGSDRLAVFTPGEKVFDFIPATVEQVTIEAPEETLLLAKKDDRWVIPSESDFPADAGKIDSFIAAVSSMKKTWPVAQSESALKPLKVADDSFERKIVFTGAAGASIGTLYLGTSPGVKKVHARRGDSSMVYTADFATFELPATPEAWTDKEYLYTDRDTVQEIRLPEVTLVRSNKGFTIPELADEEAVKTTEVASLVSQATMPRYIALLGTEAPEGYDSLEKTISFSLVTGSDAGVKSFKAKGPYKESFYVIKDEAAPYYLTVAKGIVEKLAGANRAGLVEAKQLNPEFSESSDAAVDGAAEITEQSSDVKPAAAD